MLQRANDEIEAFSIQHQEELEEWKSSLDRLSSSGEKKDEEIMMLTEQLQHTQVQVCKVIHLFLCMPKGKLSNC